MRMIKAEIGNTTDFLKVLSNGELASSSNLLDEINYISLGVTLDGVLAFANLMNWDKSTLEKATSITLKALTIKKNKRLSKRESELIIEVAKLSTLGAQYHGSIDNWNKWLSTPHIQFGGHPPITVLETISGRELIKSVIIKLKHGFLA